MIFNGIFLVVAAAVSAYVGAWILAALFAGAAIGVFIIAVARR